ncbi:MAG: alpha/beta hydrolase [Parvularculaceae bacterium]
MRTPEESGKIDGPNGALAFLRIAGDGAGAARPGVIWLGGFKSDMTGTKAQALADWAASSGRAFLRFDYTGHGASDGRFEDGAISDWAGDAAAALDALTSGPQILVGSSMGGWIAALLALARPERIAGVVFVAPAPDFTEELMWPAMGEDARAALMRDGYIEEPSEYSDEPTIITRRLIEDGRANGVLGRALDFNFPVRIIQGMADPDVPWRHAVRFAEAINGDDVIVTLIKSGDHRLSTPADIERLVASVAAISA